MYFFPVLPDFSLSFLQSIRGAQQEAGIRRLSTPQHPRKNKKHRITAKTVDETPTTQFHFCPTINPLISSIELGKEDLGAGFD